MSICLVYVCPWVCACVSMGVRVCVHLRTCKYCYSPCGCMCGQKPQVYVTMRGHAVLMGERERERESLEMQEAYRWGV